jgi:hypothetical protein
MNAAQIFDSLTTQRNETANVPAGLRHVHSYGSQDTGATEGRQTSGPYSKPSEATSTAQSPRFLSFFYPRPLYLLVNLISSRMPGLPAGMRVLFLAIARQGRLLLACTVLACVLMGFLGTGFSPYPRHANLHLPNMTNTEIRHGR